MILHIAPLPMNRAYATWTEVSLPVEDLGLSLRFYIDALGLNVVHWEEGWAILRDPDTGQQLYLHELASHSHPPVRRLRCRPRPPRGGGGRRDQPRGDAPA
jgi:catechol 2,3-dioxygenase-like lactoylglutathione lyase family enzyme